jgi:hypothetical protein
LSPGRSAGGLFRDCWKMLAMRNRFLVERT